MNDEQTKTLSLKTAYEFGAEHGLEREVNEIREMIIEWDLSYTSSLRRGYVVDLFEKHGIFDAFKKKHWTLGNTPSGESKRLLYQRIKARYEEFLAGRGPEPASEEDEGQSSDPGQASEFALEAHLRDFLAKNLDRIETVSGCMTVRRATVSSSRLTVAASTYWQLIGTRGLS